MASKSFLNAASSTGAVEGSERGDEINGFAVFVSVCDATTIEDGDNIGPGVGS
jgi:hypothetical protein